MPLAFTQTTFAQAKTQVAQLLGDPGKVFYSDAEIGTYIVEALRFWGSLTGYWRDRGVFTTSAGGDNPWYDLPAFLPQFRGYNVIDSLLVQQIEYHLLEPASVPYSGSSQFNQSAIVNALQRRLDQFLLETSTVITHSQIQPPASPIDRIILPDSVIAVRRAAWRHAATLAWKCLPRSDEFTMLSYYQAGRSPTVPDVYSVALTPPLTILVAPPPNDIGLLDLLTVNSGAQLSPVSASAGVLLGIPDDLAWIVKFGALADLLSADGPAKDPQRAAYCQQRWDEGIAIAKISASAMFCSVDGVPLYLESLDSVDRGMEPWQNYSGTPTIGAMAGLNLLAMVVPPDGQHSVTLDLVTNAIVPSADGDFIQTGREELAVILGYAEHLGTFKCGGAEFMATMKNRERIMSLASVYNSKLAAATQPNLTDRAQLEQAQRPEFAMQGAA